MGCFIVIIAVLLIWAWYLIYKYVGHTPISSMSYIYPDHYTRNWFGDIWVYSFIWLPLLIILFVPLIQNRKFIIEKIRLNKKKTIASLSSFLLVVVLLSIFTPKIKEYIQKQNTYDSAVYAMQEEDYLSALNYFEEVIDYKDSQLRITKIHEKLLSLSTSMIRKEQYYGQLEDYLDVLNSVPSHEKKAKEMKGIMESEKKKDLEQKKRKLLNTAPYEGMSESDIYSSKWGPPTEIKKDINYEHFREERQVKHFKWVYKDNLGRTIEIRSLMVKKGQVWGEPEIHHYFVNK